jgi:endonuclease III-like uncharacterized protein
VKWLEKKTGKGVLKYRMPNVVEGYEFLSLVENTQGTSGFFKAKAKFISNLSPLLDYSICGYSSFDELLNDKENMMQPLSEISQEVLDDIMVAFQKKL